MSLPLERIISGKYEILYKLGEGGMGAVYKVRHRLLDEARVVKVLRQQYAVDPEVRKRFEREARTASRLRHPNIAHLHEFSMDDQGNAFIVMEFIEGITLQEMLSRSGPPGLALALEIGRQTLAAIGHLHEQGIIHRDIAADNLMLTSDFNDDPLVKLIDLGIAKDLAGQTALTRAGTFMGKARYSAPEQFAAEGGAAKLDRRSDLYSFGVLLYELLTGRCPIEGESFPEIAASHLFKPPLTFDVSDPEGRVPPDLRRLVMKALEKDPEQRSASAAELAAALAEHQPAVEERRADFTRILETTSHLTPAEGTTGKVGSTQDRLDQQFRAGEPTPGPGRTAADLVDELRGATVGDRAAAERGMPEGVIREPGAPEKEVPERDSPKGTVPEGQSAAGAAPAEAAAGARRSRASRSLLAAGAALLVVAAGVAYHLLGPGLPGLDRGARSDPESPRPPLQATPAGVSDPRGDVAPGPGAAPVAAEPASLKVEDEIGSPELEGSETGPLAGLPTEAAEGSEGAADEQPESPSGEPAPEEGAPSGQEPVEPGSAESGPAESGPAESGSVEETAAGPAAESDLLEPGLGVLPPRLLSPVVPLYPQLARELGVEARVVVAVLVDESGSVIETRLEEADASEFGFNEAALRAARLARFEPASRDGVPGRMWTLLPFDFPER